MTVEEVEAALKKIEAEARRGDDESAHVLEDKLHIRVLNAVAVGAINSKQLAAHALRTCDIEFSRWYA